MYRKAILIALLATFAAGLTLAADSPRFRGPNGDGIFEGSGLLTSWPEAGPELLWTAEGLGESYASVSVAGGRLYTTGISSGRGNVYAFDLGGNLLWKKDYGPEFNGSGYPGSRTTPTVYKGALYLLSALGKAVALDAATGELIWEVDLFGRFQGKNPYFGVSESPLVVDGKVIFTPGGPDASVVALDPMTGETKWKSTGLGDSSAYCTPRLFDNGEQRQIITLVAEHMAGLDPATGAVLWRDSEKAKYDIHAVSPEFVGKDGIYISHGYGQGGKFFRLAADGNSVTQVWTEPKLDVHHGGAVVLDNRIYGAASNGSWFVLEAEDGTVAAEIKKLGKGSIAYADGRLYGYTEEGRVVLVDPDPKSFREVSSFEINRGSGNHWSHPVIAGGVLYIRHGDVLMAFGVKAAS